MRPNSIDVRFLPKRTSYVKGHPSIPEPYQQCYFHDRQRGDYFLDYRIALVVHDGEAELAKLDAKMAALEQKAEREREQHQTYLIDRNLRHELEQAGVKRSLLAGAAALIRETHRFEVEGSQEGDGPVVLAHTSAGLKSAAGIVGDFLLSEDGEAFRPPRSAPDDHHFRDMLAEMKRAR